MGTLSYVRVFFGLLALLTAASQLMAMYYFERPLDALPIAVGLIFMIGAMFAADRMARRFELRDMLTVAIGLLAGYFLSTGVLFIADRALFVALGPFQTPAAELFRMSLLLVCTYAGVIFALRSEETLALQIPFVKFHNQMPSSLRILADSSVLCDGRIIDLAKSGLLDERLTVLPSTIKDLQHKTTQSDELTAAKARRGLENIHKLQELSHLKLLIEENARTSHLLTLNKLENAVKDVCVINVSDLSTALKPLMEAGQTLNVKVQRYGKEPRQGVGYLEDGSMVVINGGGEFLGETIRTTVLSVKHSSAGRIIFCNVQEISASAVEEPAPNNVL